MAKLIAGEDAEGVADGIVEAASGKIEIDVPGFLFRPALVEQTPRYERRRRGIVAGPAELGDGYCDRRGRRCRVCRRSRRLFQLLMERLEHPRGFLAAGDTKIEASFRLARNRFGIVVAIITAL